MIVVSGFAEVNELDEMEDVMNELKNKGVEVSDVKENRVVFLIERETAAGIKAELDSLKDIKGVRNVYLAYFSLEGSDIELEEILPPNAQ